MGLTESSTYQRGGLADAHSGDRVGYRVLDVVQGSPAAAAGLCQVLDFIVTANGVRLDSEDKRIQDIIAGSENEPLNLGVYNVVTETVRDVIATPRKWGRPEDGLLGMAIRFDTYLFARQNVATVQSVVPGSPADVAGFRPQTDTIIGSNDTSFTSLETLKAYIGSRDHPVVYLYNDADHSVRQVRLDMALPWGEDQRYGLGASVAHGKLHELHISDTVPANAWTKATPVGAWVPSPAPAPAAPRPGNGGEVEASILVRAPPVAPAAFVDYRPPRSPALNAAAAPTATSQTPIAAAPTAPAAAPAPAEAVAGTASPGFAADGPHATSPMGEGGDAAEACSGTPAATGPPPTGIPSPAPVAPVAQASLAAGHGSDEGSQPPTCSPGPDVSAVESVASSGDHDSHQRPVTDQAGRDDADDVIAAVLAQAAGRG